MLGRVVERYRRGWGHLTTRQNVQCRFVAPERKPGLSREPAAVGVTTREAWPSPDERLDCYVDAAEVGDGECAAR